ncbi:tRNA(Arg) A34 adenosine deaminase TadA [Kaistia hirudinis]|uniref:tRNA(Arg) A34 adenosine deaminase TadA n=1 Tax=Kaistia hirudinis TaxID=1293440 RepID=A0A840AWR5_9HYPH|nr:tRNA(Arg) A34 adenosine deaminase TadA [Kaistia hirudinis]
MTMTAIPADRTERDAHFLRLAFKVAERSLASGQHPFGAILVDAEGTVLMEQENGFMPDHDMTGHAERVLMTRAGIAYGPERLAGCTMYTSAEPCAMCAGAAYWVGLGRLVYGLSEKRLKTITGNHPENPTLDLPCETVFAAGQRRIEVAGPMLEDEAAIVHETFWAA